MICPKCGHKNDIDATFCENCGANLKTNFSSGSRGPVKREEGINKSTKF